MVIRIMVIKLESRFSTSFFYKLWAESLILNWLILFSLLQNATSLIIMVTAPQRSQQGMVVSQP